MWSHWSAWVTTLRGWALNLLGLTMLLSLPVIWVAWTGTVLLTIFGIGLAAGALYCVIYVFEDSGLPTGMRRA
jgi:hypothetical protein